MSFKTYYLAFDSEQQAEEILSSIYGENWINSTHDRAIDLIGLNIQPAVIDEFGVVIAASIIRQGWLINLALPETIALPEELQPFDKGNPLFKRRVFCEV